MIEMNMKEELAALEHEQWMSWATELMKTENLSQERLDRWKPFMVPYEELPENVKKHDRRWAERVWHIVERHLRSSKERRYK